MSEFPGFEADLLEIYCKSNVCFERSFYSFWATLSIAFYLQKTAWL